MRFFAPRSVYSNLFIIAGLVATTAMVNALDEKGREETAVDEPVYDLSGQITGTKDQFSVNQLFTLACYCGHFFIEKAATVFAGLTSFKFIEGSMPVVCQEFCENISGFKNSL